MNGKVPDLLLAVPADTPSSRKEVIKMLHIHEKLTEASKTAFLPV